jgi:hypothetical protein
MTARAGTRIHAGFLERPDPHPVVAEISQLIATGRVMAHGAG